LPARISTSDYDECGDATDNPTEGIDSNKRWDISYATSSEWLNFPLNATGKDWISKTGWTKFCFREGHDVLDNPFSGGNADYNFIWFHTSEQTGTSSDPYQCDSDLVPLVAGAAFEIMDPDEQSLETSFIDELILSSIAESYSERGINVVPIYESEIMFDSEFGSGSELAYSALLNNLPLVQESGISWDQVLEFRKDKDAVWKYRSLRLWFRDGLQAKSIQEANDIIEDKIAKYEFAIRKHGLRTITGSLSSIIDSKYVAGLAMGSGVAALIGGPIWSLIAGGSLAIGKIAVEIADRLIDLSDIKRGLNSEIAIVYEAKRQFGNKKEIRK